MSHSSAPGSARTRQGVRAATGDTPGYLVTAGGWLQVFKQGRRIVVSKSVQTETVCRVGERSAPRIIPTPLKILSVFLASTALTAISVPSRAEDILPTGASVGSGEISVSTSGSAMTVTQGSDKAIVNWNSFSIGADNQVNFVQPDASSAILNRVTGSTSSSIAGSLTGNGQVYLVNPNGIAITSSGTVRVGGGFVASTLDIDDDDFLRGSLDFKGNGASAGVSNEGIVTVGRGGYAALIGGTVKNDGLIAVPLGKIGLGSGEQATLDLSGDGFLQVALPTKDGAEGDGALVENSGTISANGGTVVMTAATAKIAARQAINMSGVVEAQSISGHDGAIVLGGGAGGTVKVSGKLKATSSTGKGGSVTVTGKAIELTSAEIDASGATGGGSVKIGGDWHGGDGLTADTTSVDAGTVIRADATQGGDGGEVVVWSDYLTSFAGTITATGAGSGLGGNAEVSGKALLAYTGFTDLAGQGGYGTLLLDPYNITISDDAASNASGTKATGDDSVINSATLEAALAGANVEITTNSGGSQAGDITVASDIDWSAKTTLTLTAANNIYINADITATGATAGLVLNYGGDDYSIASGSAITLSGANASLAINGTDYTLIHSMAELDAIDTTGLSGYYALAGDLDAAGTTYTDALVGVDDDNSFTGTFAGLGHTISNLTIANSAATGVSYGLFGFDEGTIRDIGLVDANLDIATNEGHPLSVGALVGFSYGGTISNAYSTGTVSASSTQSFTYVGGLVGLSQGAISNSYSTATVSASNGFASVGGLIGLNGGGTVRDSYASGEVTVLDAEYAYAGGLAGYSSGGTISSSYAVGAVATGDTSNAYAGGLIGAAYGTTITDTYATGSVNSLGAYAGGLVGNAEDSTISRSYASGSVTGGDIAGGLIGRVYRSSIDSSYASGSAFAGLGTYSDAGGLVGVAGSSTITNSYATGSAVSSHAAGGLVGYAGDVILANTYASGAATVISGGSYDSYAAGGLVGAFDIYGLFSAGTSTVTNSYASGRVTAPGESNYYVGGLVGLSYSVDISGTYAIGEVSGGEMAGGLIGLIYDGSGTTAAASYFDTETTKQTEGTGNDSIDGVTGLTTAEFQDTEGFMARAAAEGWDFYNTWAPSSAGYYPELYAVSPVIWTTVDDASMTYGGTVPSFSATTYGGSSSYVFDSSEDTLTVGLTSEGASASDVGTYDIAVGSSNSVDGVVYRVVESSGTLTINPAALTITANDLNKIYGQVASLSGYTVDGLVNSDSVSGVTLASNGSNAAALVGRYDIIASDASGSGLSNYTITYLRGSLDVKPLATSKPLAGSQGGDVSVTPSDLRNSQQDIDYGPYGQDPDNSPDLSYADNELPGWIVEALQIAKASCNSKAVGAARCLRK